MLKIKYKISCPSLQTFWSIFVISLVVVLVLIIIIYGLIFWQMSSLLGDIKEEGVVVENNSLEEKSQAVKLLLDRRKSL